AEKYSAEALADLYFQRWQVEVDFRHIKITMQLDVCRGKSPDVVEKEFWVHVLAYNPYPPPDVGSRATPGTATRLA
ncbi:MAG: transposase, partial [Planctomycetota bacterium]|nr:transposase [Planctomycetota bacterium]